MQAYISVNSGVGCSSLRVGERLDLYNAKKDYIMVEIMDMSICDLKQCIELWNSIPELKFPSAFDTEKRLGKFLDKNKGLSTIAKYDGEIVGALLCGDDGRRGFFYHIGVIPKLRKQKIASRMVEYSFVKLRTDDIDTCFLFTNDFNINAQSFWKSMGFGYAPHVMYQSREI